MIEGNENVRKIKSACIRRLGHVMWMENSDERAKIWNGGPAKREKEEDQVQDGWIKRLEI